MFSSFVHVNAILLCFLLSIEVQSIKIPGIVIRVWGTDQG